MQDTTPPPSSSRNSSNINNVDLLSLSANSPSFDELADLFVERLAERLESTSINVAPVATAAANVTIESSRTLTKKSVQENSLHVSC